MPEVKLHADASPSSSEMWIQCPASVTRARGRVRLPSVYTREGTAAHRIAELRLNGKKKLPKVLSIDGEDVEVTQEMLDAVDHYVRYVRDCARKGTLHVETRIDIPVEGEHIFGTSDAFVLYRDDARIEVIDYKHGKGVAVSPDGSQFKLYALGVLELVSLFFDVSQVTLTVVQPRAEGETIKTTTYSVEELTAWQTDELAPAVARLVADDQSEVPGEHCRWCVRAGECRGLAELMAANAVVGFDDLPPEPADMDDEELARVLTYGQRIVTWVNAVRAEVSARIESGRPVPGWKLVPKRAMRKWDDPEGARGMLSNILSPEEYLRIETIGAVEKALKRRKVRPEEVIYPYTIKESSGSTLVSEEDGRPAIATGADLFDDLPQITGPHSKH